MKLKLYISKDRFSGLVTDPDTVPDEAMWDSIGLVDGKPTFNKQPGIALTTYVSHLLHKAFLESGDLGTDPARHLFINGMPSGFNIELSDESILD